MRRLLVGIVLIGMLFMLGGCASMEKICQETRCCGTGCIGPNYKSMLHYYSSCYLISDFDKGIRVTARVNRPHITSITIEGYTHSLNLGSGLKSIRSRYYSREEVAKLAKEDKSLWWSDNNYSNTSWLYKHRISNTYLKGFLKKHDECFKKGFLKAHDKCFKNH